MHILHQLSQKSVCVLPVCFCFCLQLKTPLWKKKKKFTNPPLNFIQSEIKLFSLTFGCCIKTVTKFTYFTEMPKS